MDYCVVVQARGKELDQLRQVAYRVSRDTQTDWYAEPRKSGRRFALKTLTRELASVRFAQTNATEHPTQ